MTIKKAKRGVIECLGGGWDENSWFLNDSLLNGVKKIASAPYSFQ